MRYFYRNYLIILGFFNVSLAPCYAQELSELEALEQDLLIREWAILDELAGKKVTSPQALATHQIEGTVHEPPRLQMQEASRLTPPTEHVAATLQTAPFEVEGVLAQWREAKQTEQAQEIFDAVTEQELLDHSIYEQEQDLLQEQRSFDQLKRDASKLIEQGDKALDDHYHLRTRAVLLKLDIGGLAETTEELFPATSSRSQEVVYKHHYRHVRIPSYQLELELPVIR